MQEVALVKKVMSRKATRVFSLRRRIKANRHRKVSGLEKIAYQMLKEEGIPFQKEKTVGRCHADIFIAPNTLIELQGCYYHGHSCQKPPLSKMQKESMARDARRFYFFNKLGFRVEQIWECDVNDGPDKVRARLRKIYKESKE